MNLTSPNHYTNSGAFHPSRDRKGAEAQAGDSCVNADSRSAHVRIPKASHAGTEPRASSRADGRQLAAPTRRSAGTRIMLAVVGILVSTASSVHAQTDKKSDEDRDTERRLGERLVREAKGDGDDDVMQETIRLMDQATRKLELSFDAGAETQALQRRIMDKLDEAIRAAAAQRRPTRSRGRTTQADRRRAPGEAKNRQQADGTDRARATEPTADQREGSDAARATTGKTSGDLTERRRGWGNLPMRDREEIIQGIGEQFLETYRDWIERYYRALQESDE